MSDELLDAIAFAAQPAQQQEQAAPELALFAPAEVSGEQVRALDAVFAEDRGPADAAGLLGAWGAGMLLHDIAEDAKKKDRDEEEAARRQRSGVRLP